MLSRAPNTARRGAPHAVTAIRRCLIVVSRDRRTLWQALVRLHAAHQEVDVVLDRRRDPRPNVDTPFGPNRRVAQKPSRLDEDGYIVVLPG